MEDNKLATELLHEIKAQSIGNIAKYSTTEYHLISKGDLFLPYFLYKFSKNTCIFQFYVLQYNYIKERR